MANTENIEAKLCAYIDGDLDAQGRAEIEKHLAANPQHRTLIAQLAKQRDLLRELPRETAPEEILDALQSQMERSVLLGDDDAGHEAAAAMKIHRWPQLMAAAAIVVLTVGLGLVIYFVLPHRAGDTNYAVMSRAGARLEEDSLPATTESGSVVLGGGTRVTDDLGMVAPGKSAAATATPAAAAAAGGAGEDFARDRDAAKNGERPTALADAAASDLMKKEKSADVFAPSGDAGRGAGTSVVAAGDLAGVQRQLQNEEIAQQLKSSAPGGITDNSLFVVVSTADPSAARSQVESYLESNKIAWDPVTYPTPVLDLAQNQAVSLSRSQRSNVRLKSGGGGGSTGGQESQQLQQAVQPQQESERRQTVASQDAATAVQAPSQQKLQGKAAAGSAGAVSGADTRGVQDKLAAQSTQAPAAQGQQQQQEKRLGESAVQSPAAPAVQAPASPTPAQPGLADAKDTVPQPLDFATNAVQPNEGLLQATTQLKEQVQEQKQLRVVGEPATENRSFIARGMTKQQVAELQSNLSKQTTVQRAAIYEPRPSRTARGRELSDFGGGAAPTTEPSTAYKHFAAAPTTGPVTPADAGGWRDGAADERQAAVVNPTAPTTQGANTVAGATTVPTTLRSDLGDASSIALATTVPAADERVDVVILVEGDAPIGAAPAELTEEIQAPNAAPATQPAAPDAPPSTQPTAPAPAVIEPAP